MVKTLRIRQSAAKPLKVITLHNIWKFGNKYIKIEFIMFRILENLKGRDSTEGIIKGWTDRLGYIYIYISSLFRGRSHYKGLVFKYSEDEIITLMI